MTRYAELSVINKEQSKKIKENNYVVFTECDEGGSYYRRGYAWVNRIGYIILENDIEGDYFDSPEELETVARYDPDFEQHVYKMLDCL